MTQDQIKRRLLQKSSFILIDDFSAEDDPALLEEGIKPYLRDIYRDLLQRVWDPQASQLREMDRLTFVEYCKLPVIVGERLFTILDEDETGYIKEEQFAAGLSQLFFGDFHSRMRLCFRM
jgi:hypothetical protein